MKTIKLLSIILITAFLFTSCEQCSNKRDEGVIKIGVILPLTGPVAEPGNNALNGIKVAVEQFNRKNARKIVLIIEDSKSNSKDGVSAINKLIEVDKTKIIIGDIMSSVFLACAPIAEKNKVVLISPGASNPKVRDAGDYIFRDYLSDDFDGQVMANYLFKSLNKKNVCIIAVNNDYGIGVENTFTSNFVALGGEVSLRVKYEQGQIDFKSILIKIRNAKPEVLYIVGNPVGNGNIVKQMKEMNISIPITGNLSFENEEFIKVAKGSFDSIIFSAPYFDLKVDNDLVKSFVKDYLFMIKKEPDIAASLGYDVTQILIVTIQNSKFDLSNVKDKLYRIKNFRGVTGNTSINSKGDVLKDVYIKKISGNGDIYIVKLFSIN